MSKNANVAGLSHVEGRQPNEKKQNNKTCFA